MDIDHRDVVQMLRDENDLLKTKNQQLSLKLGRHHQAFRALNRMDETMRGMHRNFDVQQLIHDLLSLALHACDSENGSLLLIDEENSELVFADVIGDSRELLLNHRIHIETGIVGQVIKSLKAELIADVSLSVQWSSVVDRRTGFNTRTLMCAPLYNNLKTFGAIEIINNSSKEKFDDNDLAILRVTARFISQALQEAEDITLLESEYIE